MSNINTFQVSLPSDGDGFVGRACDDSGCRQYFKILVPDHLDILHCPYCGSSFSKTDLLTRDQREHLHKVAAEEARVYMENEIQKMLGNVFRSSSVIKYRPGPRPIKRTIHASYAERKVDNELACSECGMRFQVYGIFGYCPGCRCENLHVYDTNLAIIQRKIGEATDKHRELRHAYSDLVSTFEIFCARKARRISSESGRFQSLFDTCGYFKTHANIDMLAPLSPVELLNLRRLFQKRHLCTHGDGVINDRYVKLIPEEKNLLGTKVTLSEAELVEAANAMRKALGELVKQLEHRGK